MGRQVVWMIHDYYRTEIHMGLCFGCNDMNNCVWQGDHMLENYLSTWLFIEGNLEDEIPEKARRDILAGHMASSQALKSDMEHYERVGLKHADHSREFLIGAIEGHISNQQRKRNGARRGFHHF